METVIEGTDTRLIAFYRLNRLSPGAEGEAAPAALTNTRFDVQLSQGLPFLGSLTRADWDFLVALSATAAVIAAAVLGYALVAYVRERAHRRQAAREAEASAPAGDVEPVFFRRYVPPGE